MPRREPQRANSVAPATVPADKRLQRVTAAVAVTLLIVGLVLLEYALPHYLAYLRELALHDTLALEAEYRRAFAIMFSLIGLLSAAIGIHTLRLGIYTRRSGRFPPPEVRVIVETRLVAGMRARHIGTAMIVGGALFFVLSVGGSYWMYRGTLAALAPMPVELTPQAAPSGERG